MHIAYFGKNAKMFLLSPYLLYSYFTSLTFKHAINPCEAQGQIGTEEHCNCFDCASLSEIEGWILLPSWEGCRGGFLFQSTLPRGERLRTRNLLKTNNFLVILCGYIIFILKNLRLLPVIVLTSLNTTSFKHCEPYIEAM